MTQGIEIQGGAGEFEAAVIAVVLDRIAAEEHQAQQGTSRYEAELSPWIQAIHEEENPAPRQRRHRSF